MFLNLYFLSELVNYLFKIVHSVSKLEIFLTPYLVEVGYDTLKLENIFLYFEPFTLSLIKIVAPNMFTKWNVKS